jgi:hypothetical protein
LIPLEVIVDEVDSTFASANLFLVLTVTVASASTIGLTPVIDALCPGNTSTSEVSISDSF